jgi:hypothetical protein
MTVYVLLVAYPYEGCECIGVYSSREAAQIAFEEYESTSGECLIEERVVGDSPATQW